MSTLAAGFGSTAERHSLMPVVVNPTPAHWESLTDGDVLIWVGIVGLQQVPWEQLRRQGVFCIYYQTEPQNHCALLKSQVHEMWDFSWYNIDHCKINTEAPRLRYVPLGFLGGTVVKQPPSSAAKLTFLGGIRHGRKKVWAYLQEAVGKDALAAVYNIWNEKDYDRLLEQNSTGIFVNIHKQVDKGTRDGPVTWRNPKLLNAHGLVISQLCYWKDQLAFKGLVDFMTLDQIQPAFNKLLRMTAEERQSLADQRAMEFKERFQPSDIFKRAGIDSPLTFQEVTEPCIDVPADKPLTNAGGFRQCVTQTAHRVAVLYSGQMRIFEKDPLIVKNHIRMFNGLFGEGGWDSFAFVHGSTEQVRSCKALSHLAPLAVHAWSPEHGQGEAPDVSRIHGCDGSNCATVPDFVNPAVSLGQKYQVYKADELFRDYAREHSTAYSLVVRMRFDSVFDNQYASEGYFAELAPSLDQIMAATNQGKIVLPAEMRWEGENDRFAIGTPEVMHAYAQQYQKLITPNTCPYGAWQEPQLKCTLCSAGVGVATFPFSLFLVRDDGRKQMSGGTGGAGLYGLWGGGGESWLGSPGVIDRRCKNFNTIIAQATNGHAMRHRLRAAAAQKRRRYLDEISGPQPTKKPTKSPTSQATKKPTKQSTTWTVPSTCTMAKTAPQGGGTVDCKSGFNTTAVFFSAGHPSGTKTGRLTLTYSASMTCTVRNAALEPNARVRSPSHTRGRHTRDGSLQLV